MSGGPPSDTQADKVLEASPFLPCFLSFRPLLESTVWLLNQQVLDIKDYRKLVRIDLW